MNCAKCGDWIEDGRQMEMSYFEYPSNKTHCTGVSSATVKEVLSLCIRCCESVYRKEWLVERLIDERLRTWQWFDLGGMDYGDASESE